MREQRWEMAFHGAGRHVQPRDLFFFAGMFIIFIHLGICARVWVSTDHSMCGGQRTARSCFLFSFRRVGPTNATQIARVGGKDVYPLSHLMGLRLGF